jgi:hypothetical protein
MSARIHVGQRIVASPAAAGLLDQRWRILPAALLREQTAPVKLATGRPA